MAALTVKTINLGLAAGTYSGVTPTYNATVDGGDTVKNLSGRVALILKNTDAGIKTVTVARATNCSQGHDHDVAFTVPATTGEIHIGPFNPDLFNDASDNLLLTYSPDSANLTIAADDLAEIADAE